jgi:hypothetical protein
MNKFIDIKDELVKIVEKNTFEHNGYKLHPLIQQVYHTQAPIPSGSSNLSYTPQIPVMELGYQLIGPNCHIYLNSSQIEVIAKFIQTLNYKADFDEITK